MGVRKQDKTQWRYLRGMERHLLPETRRGPEHREITRDLSSSWNRGKWSRGCRKGTPSGMRGSRQRQRDTTRWWKSKNRRTKRWFRLLLGVPSVKQRRDRYPWPVLPPLQLERRLRMLSAQSSKSPATLTSPSSRSRSDTPECWARYQHHLGLHLLSPFRARFIPSLPNPQPSPE
jgi:hypothetical protein